jgi:hypothetical protein
LQFDVAIANFFARIPVATQPFRVCRLQSRPVGGVASTGGSGLWRSWVFKTTRADIKEAPTEPGLQVIITSREGSDRHEGSDNFRCTLSALPSPGPLVGVQTAWWLASDFIASLKGAEPFWAPQTSARFLGAANIRKILFPSAAQVRSDGNDLNAAIANAPPKARDSIRLGGFDRCRRARRPSRPTAFPLPRLARHARVSTA